MESSAINVDSELNDYLCALAAKAGKTVKSGEIFAKLLSPNDDSSRHGLLIPDNAYSFFPELPIPDRGLNTTETFNAIEAESSSRRTLKYKYYQRYPERRITRLPTSINATDLDPRLVIFSRLSHTDGTTDYYVDCKTSSRPDELTGICRLIFGRHTKQTYGLTIRRFIEFPAFTCDSVLQELLDFFDKTKSQRFIDTMRDGDTGVGMTFETRLGIPENNSQKADYKGIEIKCKRRSKNASGKINLFQQVPVWSSQWKRMTAKERIRILGQPDEQGGYRLHTQVTTTPNNLGLQLNILDDKQRIDLRRDQEVIGSWSYEMLEGRLLEKHPRTVFVTAETNTEAPKEQFWYVEFLYCERPHIQNFIKLIHEKHIVFEFLMSQKNPSTPVRNRGYPWRLTQPKFLSELFALQIQLRKFTDEDKESLSATIPQKPDHP